MKIRGVEVKGNLDSYKRVGYFFTKNCFVCSQCGNEEEAPTSGEGFHIDYYMTILTLGIHPDLVERREPISEKADLVQYKLSETMLVKEEKILLCSDCTKESLSEIRQLVADTIGTYSGNLRDWQDRPYVEKGRGHFITLTEFGRALTGLYFMIQTDKERFWKIVQGLPAGILINHGIAERMAQIDRLAAATKKKECGGHS